MGKYMERPEPDLENYRARLERRREVFEAFSPAAPVNRRDLFAGRTAQISKLLDVIAGRGEHAIVYGERGVGKTSLAAMVSILASGRRSLGVRINCDGGDDFGTIWRKIFSRVPLVEHVRGVGFTREDKQMVEWAAASLPEEPGPHDVEGTLAAITEAGLQLAIFVDEFDRITDSRVRRIMADTIKTLSDQGIDATIVIVGVADDVTQLIVEHHSIERGLSQIPMPRMSRAELEEIVRRGLTSVNMTIDQDALTRIAQLSQGLPHYTHLLAQEAAGSAALSHRDNISTTEVIAAMEAAVKRSPETLATRYHSATSTPRARTLYPDVLLAAALTKGDELGYFAASDVREPLRAITRRAYDIPAFSPHLHELSDEKRGAVLQKAGVPRRFRFRFSNPLLQPYVILRALAAKHLRVEVLDQFLG